ncbi:MAG: bifunctional diaminohydroxyphosphoribosylaminopyrimidine deaminase/5-amino-6-(5-phosphoribosylamino)uracil reductase RibD [Leeuwenhoekiella sp.]
MKIHEKYILRCLELAKNGLGTTYPNPMVGSVVVYKNKIIGEDWHRKAGEPHAEVLAIASVKNPEHLQESTIYVSLEPCSHYGKTPPCSDLIIAKGIKKVVVGTVDPFAEVAGRGIKKLLEAGCEVIVGVLEEKCQQINKRFFTFHQKKRPYIILKWAQTLDGFIAPSAETRNSKEPVWITNTYSKQLVHKWRAEEQAILIGTQTALADNPSLTTRDWDGPSPTRVVIDRTGKIPLDNNIFNKDSPTILITENTPNSPDFMVEKADFSKNLPHQVCDILFKHNLQSVIIEGGAKTLTSFIEAQLWDEARIFEGNVQFKKGIKAPEINGEIVEKIQIEKDTLKILRPFKAH